MEVADSSHGPHRHIDFVYVCRPVGGHLTAQLGEVDAARWVPVTDVGRLRTPPELPGLVAAAARWAGSRVATRPGRER